MSKQKKKPTSKPEKKQPEIKNISVPIALWERISMDATKARSDRADVIQKLYDNQKQ